jgi:SNF2 family DNA or RNA helicase
MFFKEPSRTYNTLALESWFIYIQNNWESQFTERELSAGRDLYIEGSISGLELSQEDATINYSRSRKELFYSIIECVENRFKVRTSTEDQFLGRVIAVAGLYEIEELIADEISPIKIETLSKQSKRASKKNKRGDKSDKIVKASAFKKIQLSFLGSEKGLILNAQWQDASGNLSPVFVSEETDLLAEEREQMVELTVFSREVGFQFDAQEKNFVLSDFEKISAFFSHARKRWEKSFGSFDLDEAASNMALGMQSVDIVGRAESSGKNLMELNYRFRVGSEWMDDEEAQFLAQSGKGAFFLKGRGIVALNEDQQDALNRWKVSFDLNKPNKWPRYMLYSLWIDKGIRFDLAGELKRWSKRLTKDRNDLDANQELPEFLRSYQVEGVLWMKRILDNGGQALLADEMGLGKTLQVLTLMAHYSKGEQASMIVCPASVVPVWKSELERWYPFLTAKVLKSGALPKSEKGVIWLSSYTQLRLNIETIQSVAFEYVVLDEAQVIKNPMAKVTQACFQLKGSFRLAITGTPLENKLLDVWSIFHFLMPGLMGTMPQFEGGLIEGKAQAVSEFIQRVKEQISPFILRRLKDRVAKELPAKTEVDLICPIKGAQREFYASYLNKSSLGADNQIGEIVQNKAFSLFALLTRLRQICCDPGVIPGIDFPIEDSGKVMVLLSRLNEAFDGKKQRKIVIFSQFVRFIDRLLPLLQAVFPLVNLYTLTGSTRDKSLPVKLFQEDTKPAIILVSLKAGGTGVTLNTADYLFLMDPWWNPAVENQAIDRVHRIGQKSPVFIYRMITEGTIEERIQKLKVHKKALFDSTFKDVQVVQNLQEYFGDLNSLAALSQEDTKELEKSGS